VIGNHLLGKLTCISYLFSFYGTVKDLRLLRRVKRKDIMMAKAVVTKFPKGTLKGMICGFLE